MAEANFLAKTAGGGGFFLIIWNEAGLVTTGSGVAARTGAGVTGAMAGRAAVCVAAAVASAPVKDNFYPVIAIAAFSI